MNQFFALSLLAASHLALADHYFDGMDRVHLRMNRDNHFKVMQLTDLHFGEDQTSGELDHDTLHMIRSLIGKEKPDFIAITGDIVSGQAWDRQTPRFWERYYTPLATTLTNEQVPWGIVPGFHDYEADLNSQNMLEIEAQQRYSASLPNYYHMFDRKMHHQFTYDVPIENWSDKKQTDARLWFFGTGRSGCITKNGGMNCIRSDQIRWFKDKCDEIEDSDPRKANGLAFMHHALQEHMHLVDHYPVHGQKRDMSRCQGVNTGLFNVMKDKGTVQWVSAGGDHSSDFWGTYAGINLAYGRKTGFSSYGPKFVQRGARIFDLYVDPETGQMSVDTYIRQQDGEMDEQRELNEPALISYLKSDHCVGSESVDSGLADSGWIPHWN